MTNKLFISCLLTPEFWNLNLQSLLLLVTIHQPGLHLKDYNFNCIQTQINNMWYTSKCGKCICVCEWRLSEWTGGGWSVYTNTHREGRDSKKQAAGQSRGRLRQRSHSQMQPIKTHANATVHPTAALMKRRSGEHTGSSNHTTVRYVFCCWGRTCSLRAMLV